jgi:hypothetical protein
LISRAAKLMKLKRLPQKMLKKTHANHSLKARASCYKST